jgi:hypothetical protein
MLLLFHAVLDLLRGGKNEVKRQQIYTNPNASVSVPGATVHAVEKK